MADIQSVSDQEQPPQRIEAADEQVLGVARAQAVAVAYQSLAQSLSMLMIADTNAHENFAALHTAIVTTTIRNVLGSGEFDSLLALPEASDA